VFRKYESRMTANWEEVAKETKEKLAAFKYVDIVEEKKPEPEKVKPKVKERDYGMDM
jgi:hypothetical protein